MARRTRYSSVLLGPSSSTDLMPPRQATQTAAPSPPVPIAVIPSLIGAGLALLLVRIAVVTLWTSQQGFLYSIVTSGLAAAIMALVVVIFIVLLRRTRLQDVSYEHVTSAITTYVVATLALIVFSSIAPQQWEPSDTVLVRLVAVVSLHIAAVGTFAVSTGLAGFIIVVLLIRRHERTQMLFRVIAVLMALTWLSVILIPVSTAFEALAIVATISSSVTLLLNIRRMSWLGTLTLSKKIRLFWLTVLGVFTTVVIAPMLAFDPEFAMTAAMDAMIPSGSAVPALLSLFGALFFVRVMLATVAAMPNSGLVERRSSEVEALTNLTRKIAQAVSLDDLLSAVAYDAYTMCRAHGAWVELYAAPGTRSDVRVVGAVAVGPDFVQMVHRDPTIDELLRTSSGPVHVDSVPDLHDRQGDPNAPAAVGSMMSVPLLDGSARIGTLVVISTMEYGLEPHDLRLLASFADVVSVAVDQARLTEFAIARERMQQEMNVARSIQRSLLPRASFPSQAWSVDAVMVPATDVGGDYYDYIEFANGHRGVVIADVAGKGVPAALYMATLKGIVLAEMRSALGPADLIRRINAAVWGSIDRRTYITLTCVELHEDSGVVRVARAGHTPMLVKQQDAVVALTPSGVAIGLVAPEQFFTLIDEEEIDVGYGGICLLTTDGVNERRNHTLAELGFHALQQVVENASTATASEIVHTTLHVLDEHGGDEPPHDDITIVALVYLPPEGTS
jgi:sigma-B regulation protein RsbU (phosphoserine phosphatase)